MEESGNCIVKNRKLKKTDILMGKIYKIMYREMGNNTNDKIGKVIILKNLIIEFA